MIYYYFVLNYYRNIYFVSTSIMGLLSILRKLKQKEKDVRILMLGLDNAGKTTILYQFLMNEVAHTSPTIGSNVEEVVWKNVHFIMWDLGGQDSLRAAWNTYYSNTEVNYISSSNYF